MTLLQNNNSSNQVTLDTSVGLLKQKIQSWAVKQNISCPWFPGEGSSFNPPQLDPKIEVCDVFLFGNFMAQLLNLNKWDKFSYRIWVLSNAVKKTIHFYFGIPLSQIAVIPRYQLFPINLANNFSDFDNYTENPRLIYSGRFSFSKNFGLLLRVVSKLQTEFNLDLPLSCFGNYDEVGMENLGIDEVPFFKEKIEQLIDQLPWKYPPTFVSNLDEHNWIHQIPKGSIFINLSQFYMDDFGVALAQSQSKKLPAILSNWGGHLDVDKLTTLKLNLAEPKLMSEVEINQKAMSLAKEIATSWPSFINQIKNSNDSFHDDIKINFPKISTFENLRMAWQNFLKSWGMESLCLKDIEGPSFCFFALSSEGKKYFKSYYKIFSGKYLS